VRSKWYFEFPAVLVMLALAIVGVWNLNLSSCHVSTQGSTSAANTGNTVSSKPSPEHEKWLAGKSLFKANCAACHNPKSDGTGPALQGVTARWKAAGIYQGKTGEQWMKAWIHNWHDVVDAKYKYGIDLANSRPAQMNIFPYLTDEDINNILFYIESPDTGKKVVAQGKE
jgi:mono/diheme cytochrome c family protein